MNSSPRRLVILSAAAALVAASGASATTWYVRANSPTNLAGTSWALPFNNLQSALTAAHAGDVVYIAAGTYKPTLARDTGVTRSKTFALPGGVQYLGGFPAAGGTLAQRDPGLNVTVLSGDLSGDDTPTFGNTSDNSYHVVYLSGNQNGTVLDGVTISGGYADDSEDSDYAQGGGVQIGGSASGTSQIRSCILRNNYAVNQGGGLNGGNVVVLRSTIYNNRTGNFGEGGGADFGNAQFICCKVLGNQALHGGGVKQGTTGATLINCFFSGNKALAADSSDEGMGGGAMLLGDANTSIVACTFTGNTATAVTGVDQVDSEGGAIWIGGSALSKIYNTILWDNTRNHLTTGVTAVQDQAAQIFASGTLPTLSWDIIQNLGAGIGTSNLTSNPLFVGAKGADNTYGTLDDNPAINETSPAVDSANGTLMPSDTFDLDGDGITNEPVSLDVLGQRRYVDDLNVANTGVGGLANDRGAYELPSCYANCDSSTAAPTLNVADFTCFLQKFAAGDPYANCDASTQPPILNVGDFTCFLQKFAQGCL